MSIQWKTSYVLHELMESTDSRVYCLVRGGQQDPEMRLKNLLMNAGERERQILTMDQKYTLQVLYRLGFVWPINSWDYFRRFMGVLDGLGYFDKSFED